MTGTPAQLRGADLERRIEQYLTAHGYACRRNAVAEGRSGGRHEVDVLAEKQDGVTSYRLAVECKAWNRPVEKDVVAKLAFVVRDLGLHKGIVVSLGGCRLGAEQSARELGVELWGPAELEVRLGRLLLAEVAAGPPVRLGDALPVRCPRAAAERLVRGERRGWLGPARERIEWVTPAPAWVPHHLVCLSTTAPESRFLSRPALQATWRWNLYEAVTGTFARTLPTEPATVEADLALTIPAAVAAGALVGGLRQAAARRDAVVTGPAQDRHAAHLERLGIPPEAVAVTVEGSRLVHLPYHLALLTSGRGARIVAVDAHRGAIGAAMGEVLTGVIGSVVRAVQG